MSKRSIVSVVSMRAVLLLSVTALTLIALLPANTYSQVVGPVRVEIESVEDVFLGETFEVPIGFQNDSMSIVLGGFDLLIEYDPDALLLLGVTEGELLLNCDWEFFTYRIYDGGYTRIVAIADVNNGTHHPSCRLEGAEGTLATLQFQVSSDSIYDCVTIPLQFYWIDCGDNLFSSLLGDSVYFSDHVWDYEHNPIHQDSELPTYFGAPDNCIAGSVRLVDYYAGFVNIHCYDDIDGRGDININLIAYEIADYVIFRNFFIEGLSVFTLDPPTQIANTDINANGLVLELADLVYLYQVIIGDLPPIPKPGSGNEFDTAVFIQDQEAQTVTLDYSGVLAAAYLTFDGAVIPVEDEVQGISIISGMVDDSARVLISPLTFQKDSFGSGLLFNYTGTGRLVNVVVQDYEQSVIVTEIVLTGASECGDIDGSGVIEVSDAVYLMTYIFAQGDPPQDERGGDVDCDGISDISDAVYLILYIFAFGPAPCADCP